MATYAGAQGGATIVYPWPRALEEVTLSLLRIFAQDGRRAERIEITFGDRSLDLLGRDLLRRITDVATFEGLTVVFPEEPGPRLLVIEVKVSGGGAWRQVGVEAGLMAASDHAAEEAAAMRRKGALGG